MRMDIGLAALSYKKTPANCFIVRLALLAYNILRLMSRKNEKSPRIRIRSVVRLLQNNIE